MKWVAVKSMFRFSKPLSSAGFQIKKTYESYLLDYERRCLPTQPGRPL
jgi:hypothetical protein